MSSKPGTAQWLILTMERAFGVFDMCRAVESAGYAYKSADELPLNRDELIPDDACVVLNGPAARVAELSRQRGWYPRGWCEPDVFACRTYYSHWRRHLLQEHFAFLPLGALERERSHLFGAIAAQDRVFIRPDAFDKRFDGGLVERDDFDAWLRRTRSVQTPDDTLCVVARPQVIENEWRLILRDRRVIAGSSYRIGGRVEKSQVPPARVVEFAESVAAEPYPGLPNIYVLDVAFLGDRLAVVEVGSINACGFYGCDMSTVIKAVSDEAENAWRSAHGIAG
jgi:hypothetical protein